MSTRSRSYGAQKDNTTLVAACTDKTHEALQVLKRNGAARSRNRGVELLQQALAAETVVSVAARSRSYGVHKAHATAVAACTWEARALPSPYKMRGPWAFPFP